MAGRGPLRFRYSHWDGSTPPLVLDPDEILAQLGDDLLYHGELEAALRRLLQQGFRSRDGREVQGLRELMQRVAERRRELAERSGVAGRYEEIRRRLDEIVDTERRAIDSEAFSVARAPGDSEADVARREQAAQRAAERHSELDLLPSGLGEQIAALDSYDFVSLGARAALDELLAELRRDLAQMQLDRAAGALAGATPEQREHLRAGLDALNRMLEQRAAGQPVDPSFESFMEQFGDLFPGGAQSLDELLAHLAQRMAAASALIASMTPEQRAELDALAEQLLGDLDLAWQLDRLGSNLRTAMPGAGWDAGMRLPGMSGSEAVEFAAATDAFGELGSLDELGRLLGSISSPGELSEVDLDRAGELLGPDAAQSLRALSELTRRLEEAGLVNRKGGRLALTPRGLRRLGSLALAELYSRLRRDRVGDHPTGVAGYGHDRSGETKPYEYGDPFRLDVERTLRNAIERSASQWRALEGSDDGERAPAPERAAGRLRPAERQQAPRRPVAGGRPVRGGGIELPIRLEQDDFAIERDEQHVTASTVLAIDLSLSMPMRDNFLAAKKVAMALQSLIASRYPRDYLGLVGFSATARRIRPEELPEVSWDFAYGTNLQHALALSRKMLANRPGARQIIVITDGEPTAHVQADGEVFFNYPPVPETLEATLVEVGRCTRERIRINTFVLDATGGLRSFIEQLTRRNRGRAFFTTPDSLGDYLLLDFVEHRSARSKRLRPGA
jgi:uncharacterized protein with von Willebrand factor type A (vWA) domain